MVAAASHVMEGHVSRGFEPVRDAFKENFARRAELGGACCAFYGGEKVVDLWGGLRNKVTGEYEAPSEDRMLELERIVMPTVDDRASFRRGLISAIGAFRLDHPDGQEIDYVAIFPDLFRRLRDHYFEERKRQLRRSRENVLRYLSDERASLDDKAKRQVEDTLRVMRDRYGYCEQCAQDAILFLMRRRYED